MTDTTLRRILALLVFCVALVVYLLTMAASVSFWDAGEFIATSFILGIPHSPGTPLYVLVGRVFSMLPLPISIAERVTFLSVFFASLGVVMAYFVMVAVLRFMFGPPKSGIERFARYVGPLVGSFFLTFSHTYWWDATEAEVYALSAFVMGFCTWLALRWYRNPSGEIGEKTRLELESRSKGEELEKLINQKTFEGQARSRNLVYLIVYLLSLCIGIHLGTILVFGGIFLLFVMVKDKAFSNMELLIFTFGLAVVIADMTLHKSSQATVIGLIVLAVLIIWSTISEGKFALTATALFVLGVSVHLFLYIRSGLNPAIDEVNPETWESLYAHLRREQYPPINVFKRKASIIFQAGHFLRYYGQQFRMIGDVKAGPVNLGIVTLVVPTVLGLYGIVANYLREKRTWVLNFSVLALNSIGLIVFLNFSDSEVRERDYFYGAAFFYFSIFIGIGATSLLMLLVEYGKEKGREIAQWIVITGIVLLAMSLLPANYHWFSHDRSNNYIARDYAYNLLAGLEPDAIIFTNGDNDTFPLWYIQEVEGFRKDVRVANRMLLNTPWYFRQLRDENPKVPASMTDREIEELRPVPVKGGGVVYVSELAINHIIRETNWGRPIYFAVSVPPEVWKPYEEYLVLEGMVRRLVPEKGKDMINEFMLARSFDDIFEFRGVVTEGGERDDSVHRTFDMRGMFLNFSLAVTQLGQIRAMQNDYEEAVERLELALKLNPDLKWPRLMLGSYYHRNGERQKAIDHYRNAVKREPGEAEYWMRLARIFELENLFDAALGVINEGIQQIPGYRNFFIAGFRISARIGQTELAKQYVKRWLELNPDDQQFRGLYNNIDQVLADEFGIAPAGADSLGAGADN